MKKSALRPSSEAVRQYESDIVLPTNKALLRVDEVSILLSCSRHAIYKLTDVGELEAVSISSTLAPERNHKRITVRSVANFINRRRKDI